MERLLEKIKAAVRDERFVISDHADSQAEKRGAAGWQLVAGLESASLERERPQSNPNPSIVVRQLLPDGSEVKVIWSWIEHRNIAKLVTVYVKE